MLAYTYTAAKDVSSNPGSTAASAWSSNTVVSYLNAPDLSYSSFAMPHRVVGNISYRIEYARHLASTFSLYYSGAAQGRSTFAYSNDMNGDGNASDLMYIPASKDEILFQDFKADDGSVITADQQSQIFADYVNSDPYLKKNKGKYAERFGYVEPWYNRWDFKFLQDVYSNFGSNRRYTLQVSLDILNVGNLLNKNWGVYQTMGSANYDRIRPLTYKGRNAEGAPIYTLNTKPNKASEAASTFNNSNTWQNNPTTGSTWGMLLGFRFIF